MRSPGLWRVTRNAAARRLWEWLADRGIRLTRLTLYRTGSLSDVPAASLGPEITLDVRRGAAVDTDAFEIPIAPSDWLVQARTIDGVVGMVVLSIDRPVPVEALEADLAVDGGYLWALYVAASHRRQGIGAALVGRALGVAARETETCFALVAPDNRPSRNVFEGLGFTVEGSLTYLSVPGVSWRSDIETLSGVQLFE